MQTKHVFTIFALSFFAVAGCGPDPNLGQVSGTITYKGQPVAGAKVSFRPTAPEGILAVGTTDAAGKYVLAAPAKKGTTEGAFAGKYTVTIRKLEVIPSKNYALFKEGKITYDELQKRGGAGGGTSREMLPIHYSDPKKSGLEAEVEARAENVFDFTLE